MDAVRVAIVGTGGIAQRHGRALSANAEARIVAAYDADSERAEAFAAEWGGVATGSFSDAIERADAVYVLTPPGFRRGYAVDALRAGKHVFCEKPLAITPEDGLAIVEAAEATGRVAMTGFNMRYRTGYRMLYEAAQSGNLGTCHHFWSQRFGMGAGARGSAGDRGWRTDPGTLCGMTVESLSHDIDLLRWIMGQEVVSVSGLTFSTAGDLPDFDNNAHVIMELSAGATALITASWSSRIGFNSRGVLGLHGTSFVSGTALGNNGIWCSREFHYKTDADEYERVEMIQDDLDDRSYQAETDDFLSGIVQGTTPLTSVRDGYETLRVSHAILESARTKSTVRVSD